MAGRIEQKELIALSSKGPDEACFAIIISLAAAALH